MLVLAIVYFLHELNNMESSSPDEQKGAADGVKDSEEVKSKIENCGGRGLEVDQELDALLDCEL